MKKLAWIIIIPILLASCNAQNSSKNGDESKSKNSTMITENKNKPKVDIKVNKKYDEYGNLIGYDSTYTWTYSNIEGDSIQVNADSVINHFRPYISDHYPFMIDPFYDNIFLNDSDLYNNFYNSDYYLHLWEEHDRLMNKAFRELDSIKSEFFRNNYPGLQPVK